MKKPGATFEWYMKTFYSSVNAETLSDDDLDRYMSEFEIWQDASGENKRKMWPTRTKSYTDLEEREDSLPR